MTGRLAAGSSGLLPREGYSLLGEEAVITPVQAPVCQVAADALDVLTFPADSSMIVPSDRRIPRVGNGGPTAVFMSISPVGVPPVLLHHYKHNRVVPRTGRARFRHLRWHPYGACLGTVDAWGGGDPRDSLGWAFSLHLNGSYVAPAVEDALTIPVACRNGRDARDRGGSREGTGMFLPGQGGDLPKDDDRRPGIDHGNERRLAAEEARWA